MDTFITSFSHSVWFRTPQMVRTIFNELTQKVEFDGFLYSSREPTQAEMIGRRERAAKMEADVVARRERVKEQHAAERKMAEESVKANPPNNVSG